MAGCVIACGETTCGSKGNGDEGTSRPCRPPFVEGSPRARTGAAHALETRVRRRATMETTLRPMYEPETLLTTREREIVRQVAFGLHNAEVAAKLAISAGTVRKHLEHVFRKLGVRRRHELSSYALRLG